MNPSLRIYKNWQMFDELPEGYKFDNTVGSPLFGYRFATDGKSIINGGRRILVKFQSGTPSNDSQESTIKVKLPDIVAKTIPVIDGEYVKTVNELARKKFEVRLLADIQFDLMVCEIEGWSKKEYISELKRLINGLIN